MAIFLKQSTAVTIKLGPFVDSTDAVTAETGLTISQADIRLSKNGGAFAQTNNAAGATHDENGYYGVPLNTTDTGTLGILKVAVNESGALPVWQEFIVVPANVYDSLVAGTDNFDTEVVTASIDAIADQVWDEDIENAHFASESAATAVKYNLPAIFGSGGSATANTYTLSGGMGGSAVNDYYNGMWFIVTGGLGRYQARLITDYDGATKVVTVSPNFATQPNAGASIMIVPVGNIAIQGDVNVASVSAGAITAAAIATGAIDADALAADAVAEIANEIPPSFKM